VCVDDDQTTEQSQIAYWAVKKQMGSEGASGPFKRFSAPDCRIEEKKKGQGGAEKKLVSVELRRNGWSIS